MIQQYKVTARMWEGEWADYLFKVVKQEILFIRIQGVTLCPDFIALCGSPESPTKQCRPLISLDDVDTDIPPAKRPPLADFSNDIDLTSTEIILSNPPFINQLELLFDLIGDTANTAAPTFPSIPTAPTFSLTLHLLSAPPPSVPHLPLANLPDNLVPEMHQTAEWQNLPNTEVAVKINSISKTLQSSVHTLSWSESEVTSVATTRLTVSRL
jgi:hypothetical protein